MPLPRISTEWLVTLAGLVAAAAAALVYGASSPALDLAAERERMVQGQLQGRDITDARVLAAMRQVRREAFMPATISHLAYLDQPLPIGWDQTISQPYVVAMMTQLLQPQPSDKLLEVGTGMGYQAAVLGAIAAAVHSIEIVEPLCQAARKNLQKEGFSNVQVHCGDGYRGLPEHAPFDGILVAAAPDHVPQALKDQLAEGGRLVLPVGRQRGLQQLTVVERRGDGFAQHQVLPVRFVPMTGEAQGTEGGESGRAP